VGAWEDKTANEDDVTQGTADDKPTLQTNELNGESVLRFDGSNDYLQGAFTTGGSISQPNTVFVVAKLDTGTSNDGTRYACIDGDDSSNRHYLWKNENATPDNMVISGGTLLQGDDADESWNIWTVLFDTTTSQFWRNGVSENSGNAGSNAMDGLTVGAAYSTSHPWDGDIAEIIIYDSELNDADKNEVGGYLGDRYNISYSDIT
jgi:hypothetical protein